MKNRNGRNIIRIVLIGIFCGLASISQMRNLAPTSSVITNNDMRTSLENNEVEYQHQQRQQQQQQQQRQINDNNFDNNFDNRMIRLVQIGANDGSSNGNDHFVRSLLLYNRTEAILIEPNPQVYGSLLENIQIQYRNSTRVRGVNALICNPQKLKSNVDALTFYIVNNTMLLEDYPSAPHWVKYQLSSLLMSTVNIGLRHYIAQNCKSSRTKCEGRIAIDYIYSANMTCMSYQNLLINRSGWHVDHHDHHRRRYVDVVAIDTEGYDAEVVRDIILNTPSTVTLLPRIIIFEQKHLKNDDLIDIMRLLHDRGYKTDCDDPYRTYLLAVDNMTTNLPALLKVKCLQVDVIAVLQKSMSGDHADNDYDDHGNYFTEWLMHKFLEQQVAATNNTQVQNRHRRILQQQDPTTSTNLIALREKYQFMKRMISQRLFNKIEEEQVKSHL